MSDLEARIAEVLAEHSIESHGMSYQSPDRCKCQHKTLPAPGETDVIERRAVAFAAHQAAMLAPAIREAQAEAWDDGALAAYQSMVHGDTSTNPHSRSNDE